MVREYCHAVLIPVIFSRLKQTQHFLCWVFLSVFFSALIGCSFTPRGYANQIASQKEWQSIKFSSGDFVLHGFHGDFSSKENTLVVYIGGDGHAWKNRWTPSTDPTPWNPVALRLAVQTPEPKVLFLGRPCQFTTHETRTGCHPKYWTSHRYSQEVIDALDEALDQAKVLARTEKIILAGYSGGGVLVALLSAQRDDVTHFVTIAANLDLDAWVKEQGISPLSGSLNPADFAVKLKDIPQTHLVGEKDFIVSPAILQSYLLKLHKPLITQWVVIPNYDHQCCWVDSWQELYVKYLMIQTPKQIHHPSLVSDQK